MAPSSHFSDDEADRYFTLKGYQEILTRAIESGYDVVPFRDFAPPLHRPVLLLRHDLDHTIFRVRPIAEIEAALGVCATYFVQTSCEFYNLLAPAGRGLLRYLTALGHEVGLHYVAADYEHPGRSVQQDVRLLEDLTGQRVVSASQHIPIDGGEIALPEMIRNEAYEARFTESPMTYISDSLMAWRQATPHSLLDRGASFQFLTHPETWCGEHTNMDLLLEGLCKEEVSRVTDAYGNLQAYYRKLLEERRERDLSFKERARRRGQHVQTEQS